MREFLQEAFGHVDLDWREYVEIDPRYLRPAEVDLLVGDAGKAKRLLGWQPRVTFRELVRLMVEADLELLNREQNGTLHNADKMMAKRFRAKPSDFFNANDQL